MSWLSQLGGGIKDAAVGVGHAVGNVADNKWTKAALAAGLAATGVGAPLAAGIMGGTGLLGGALHEGGGLHDGLVGGATGAATGAAAGLAGGMLRGGMPSITGIGSKLGGLAGAAKSIPGVGSAIDGLTSRVPGLQGVSDFLGGNGGQNALAAAQGVNAAMLGKKSSDFANNAMGSVQQNWDERAPLRTAGQAGMLNPGQGIAPRIAAIPNHNMYAKTPTLGPARIG